MQTQLKPVTYAQAMLMYLKQESIYRTTQDIMKACALQDSIRPQVIGILNQLVDIGTLAVIRGRPASWLLIKKNYNQNDPFEGGKPLGANYGTIKTKEKIAIMDQKLQELDGPTPALPKREIEQSDLHKDVFDLLLEVKSLRNEMNSGLQRQNQELLSQVELLKKSLADVRKVAESTTRDIVIKKHTPTGTKTKTLKGVVLPEIFQDVLDLAQARRNIMLVGPAGCGKTYTADLIAKTMGLKFGSISCSGGMNESHLSGKATPNMSKGTSVFQSTEFLDCYENGGVFLLDELDAADSNVLIVLNSAIDNGYFPVPNRPGKKQAERHEDFVLIATANTYGKGASRMYCGRNQLDEATLGRFQIGVVECSYDKNVETAICPSEEIRTTLWGIRQRVELQALRRTVSTRFLRDAHIMHTQANWNLDKIKKVLVSGWSEDEIRKAGVF